MAGRRIDPASLSGEALKRWYERSPSEMAEEAQRAEAQKFADYGAATRQRLQTPDASQPGTPTHRSAEADDALWIATGRGGWRAIQPSGSDFQSTLEPEPAFAKPNHLPANPAGLEEGRFIEVGNPANPKLRREWEVKWGLPWPKDPTTGRNYDVSHIVAKADGGTDTVDNIRPQLHAEHVDDHSKNGDFKKWGGWSGKGKGGPAVRGSGLLGIIPDITGILSGRIRTDTFDNFTSDILGFPSEDDRRKAFEERQRLLNPRWKPGDPFMT